MLKAVLFDLDNTLVDRDDAFRRCVEEHFTGVDVRAKLISLDRKGQGDRETLLNAWKRSGGNGLSLAGLGELIAERLSPDETLLEAIRSLAQNLAIGIVTNGGSQAQRRKMRAAGLDRVVPSQQVWISAEVNLAKPDPEMFLLASRSLRVRPEECLFIGDYEPHDREGASAAGMRSRIIQTVLNGVRLDEIMEQERTR
jgi:putative hydrolase of the HAD superfamily